MSAGGVQEEGAKSALPVADLSLIDEALGEGDEALKEAMRMVRPADVGRDLSRRDARDAARLFRASDERRAAGMLRAAHPTVAGDILASAEAERAARVLARLPTDQQVAILSAVSEKARASLESAIEKRDRARLDRILAYPPSAVGRVTTPWVLSCDRGVRVQDALDVLRANADEIEVAQNCYVLSKDKLVGVAPLRLLVVTDPGTPIDEIMTRDVLAVSEDTEIGDAAEIIRTHDFLSLPVIDGEGRLVGAVRVDDLLDAALDQAGAELLNQGAVAGKVAAQLPYFRNSIFRVVRSRITWLILLFVAETATGYVLRHFEGELAKVVALSFFIPLLIGTGGNAGSQTVSTIIRALAIGEVRVTDALRVIAKEVTAGITLGLLLGSIAFGRALLWGVGVDIAACVAVTIVVVCTWANAVGATIPIAAQKLGIDPTVVSGPLITTLVDASGLFIYLSVAKLMIAQLG